MEFNELQTRLWAEMLKLIMRYRKEDLCYSDFIYGLEGCLDAGEYQDKKLIGQWYDYWTPLEILFTTKGNTTLEDANKYLSKMEMFLKSKFNLQENKASE